MQIDNTYSNESIGNDLSLRHQAQLDQGSYTIGKDIRLDVESVWEKLVFNLEFYENLNPINMIKNIQTLEIEYSARTFQPPTRPTYCCIRYGFVRS